MADSELFARVDIYVETPDCDRHTTRFYTIAPGVDAGDAIHTQVVNWCSTNGYAYEDEASYEVTWLEERPIISRLLD